MKDVDIIFVHPPINFQSLKHASRYRTAFLSIPMGVFGLADLLAKNGLEVKIFDYPLEFIINSNFSLIRKLKEYNFKVLAVDLHWALHAHGATEILRVVKKVFPSCFTLLGGYTASFFSDEIITHHDYVDGVIRGDAEVPIVELMKNLNSLENVPNLTYRENGKIKKNDLTYVANELDSLNFSRIQYLEHWKEYLYYSEKKMGFRWPVEVARGCSNDCIFCGGGRFSARIISNRNRVVFRSPQRVVDDLREITELAEIERFFYGHGIYPATEKYFMEINRLIRKEGLELGVDQEIWRLPVSKHYILDHLKTFKKKSLIIFSPRIFSESQRKKMDRIFGKFDSSFRFTNKQLWDLLKTFQKHRIPILLFWDIGYPRETGIDIIKNSLQALRAVKYRNMLLMEPIHISPGSFIFFHGDKYGIEFPTKTFQDYCDEMKTAKMGVNPLEYHISHRSKLLPKVGIRFVTAALGLITLVSYLLEE